jgi:hypothetical protein
MVVEGNQGARLENGGLMTGHSLLHLTMRLSPGGECCRQRPTCNLSMNVRLSNQRQENKTPQSTTSGDNQAFYQNVTAKAMDDNELMK